MNLSTKTPSKPRSSAFTLLELVFGMGLAGIILTGVYGTAVGCIRLANKVAVRQQGEMHMHSLLGVLRRNIEDIPGNASISMEPPSGGIGGLVSEIVLEDYPLAFSWAGVPAGSKRVLLVTDRDPRGGTRIRIRYLNAEEAEAHAEQGGLPDDEGVGIVLMDGLKSVFWRFYNQRTEEWEEDWVRPNERPSLVEMNIEFHDGSETVRSVFWIPVVVNPETIARGARNAGSGQNGGVRRPTGPNNPGGGGGRPNTGGARPNTGGARPPASGATPAAPARPTTPGARPPGFGG